ncbi:PepE Peptidase E [Burkholderiales bacterium]|jgi:peptidase E
MTRQILAIGGAALPMNDQGSLKLIEHFLSLTRARKPKVCFIGTAHGDAEAGRLRYYAALSQFNTKPTHLPLFARTPQDIEGLLCEQDAILVGGGNTRSMLTVWRDWGVDLALRKAYDQGVVLGGWSAGSICWFEQGVTDSIAGPLTVLPCLGFLEGSNCPHYDSERDRRPTYEKLIGKGLILPGLAADDGVGLHFINEELVEVVSQAPKARGWRVRAQGKAATSKAIKTRAL